MVERGREGTNNCLLTRGRNFDNLFNSTGSISCEGFLGFSVRDVKMFLVWMETKSSAAYADLSNSCQLAMRSHDPTSRTSH